MNGILGSTRVTPAHKPLERMALATLAAISTTASSFSGVLFAQSEAEPTREHEWSSSSTPAEVWEAVTLIELLPKSDKAVAATHERATPVQVGYFIDRSTVVTSLGGLEHARVIQCVRGNKRVRMDVVAADARLDLAALRPSGRGLQAEGLFENTKPVRVTEEQTGEDAEPLRPGAFTLYVTHGDPPQARVLPVGDLFDEAGVLPVDTITLGLSNLPIVDAQGNLLAMWRWPAAEEPLTASSVIAGFVSSIPDVEAGACDLPPLRAASMSFPRLSWGKPKGRLDGTTNAIQRCKELAFNLQCSRCGGDGFEEIVQVHDPDGPRRRKSVTKLPCAYCEKSRYRKPLEMWHAARTLAAICTGADPRSEHSEAVTRALEDGVRAAAAMNPSEFHKRLRDAAREDLSWRNSIPGRSIAFFVHSGNWRTALETADDKGVLTVTVDDKHVILIDSISRHIAGESNDAFIVGTVAGAVRWHEKDWVVVERVRAVPVKPVLDRTGR